MNFGLTQLILDADGDAVTLPESRRGGYTAARTMLYEDVEMISGRLVRELRGNVWVLGYQYSGFPDALKNRVIAACEKGKREPVACLFLTPDGGRELEYSQFFVTKFTYPKFYWGKNDHGTLVPLWGDFNLTLREVRPHD